jgi:hypothetical protein
VASANGWARAGVRETREADVCIASVISSGSVSGELAEQSLVDWRELGQKRRRGRRAHLFGRDYGKEKKGTREGLAQGCCQVGSGVRWVCLPTLWLARREDMISTRLHPSSYVSASSFFNICWPLMHCS